MNTNKNSKIDVLKRFRENLNREFEIATKLNLTIQELLDNMIILDELDAIYYYNPKENGISMILASDGTYLVSLSSNLERQVKEFIKGKRNGTFNEIRYSNIENDLENKDILDIISNKLNLTKEEILQNISHDYTLNLSYIANGNLEGYAMVLSDDGSYLTLRATTTYDKHINEFLKGRRNGKIDNYIYEDLYNKKYVKSY